MIELPSTFNPSEVTAKWDQRLLPEKTPRLTNRDLFGLVGDIIRLNWDSYQKHEQVALNSGEEMDRLHVELSEDSTSERIGFEEYYMTVDRIGEDCETIALRRTLRGKERFSTSWYFGSIYSSLAGDTLRDEYLVPVRLTNQQRVTMARNLWRAHLDTVSQEQQAIA